MFNAVQMNNILRNCLLDNIVSSTKRGIYEDTSYVYGKNVKWFRFNMKTGEGVEKIYPLENWYIPVTMKVPFEARYIDSFCEQLAKEIIKYENELLHGTDLQTITCHQLCDWEWLEDEEGRILRHIPGDKENIYQAILVKYAKFLTKDGEPI